jgi:hypothetical protein
MIAISIRQPWAYLITCRGKDIENRSWALPTKYIGKTVLIHASSTEQSGCTIYQCLDLARGGIVGIMQLVGCTRDSLSDWAEPTMYHWQIANARPLPFFPCAGRLGFFNVDYPQHMIEAPYA